MWPLLLCRDHVVNKRLLLMHASATKMRVHKWNAPLRVVAIRSISNSIFVPIADLNQKYLRQKGGTHQDSKNAGIERINECIKKEPVVEYFEIQTLLKGE